MSTTSTVTTLSELDILGLAKAIIKSDKAIRNKLFNTKIFKEAPLLKNNFRVSVLETCNEAFLLEKNTILPKFGQKYRKMRI